MALATETMTAIEANDLCDRRGNEWVLDSVDFTVEESAAFGLHGPTGAGKSALLDLLIGRERPTEGRLRLFGLDPVADGDSVHDRMGVLRECVDLDPRVTGWEHLHHATSDGDPTTPAALLDRVGVAPETARRPAETYPTGTARRIGLAMALAGDPDLLVVEEPTAGLDARGAARVRSVLREVARTETTVLVLARRWSAAFEGCDRVGILRDGRLERIEVLGDGASPDGEAVVELHVDRVPSVALESIPGVEAVVATDGRISAVVSDPAAKATVVLEVGHADVAIEDVQFRPADAVAGPQDESEITDEER